MTSTYERATHIGIVAVIAARMLAPLRPMSAADLLYTDKSAQYAAAAAEYDHAIDVDDTVAESHWRGVMCSLNAELDALEESQS